MKMKLDLESDILEVFGKTVRMTTTSAGHYCVNLMEELEIEEVCAVDIMKLSDTEELKTIRKLHNRFGHTPRQKFLKFLHDCGV